MSEANRPALSIMLLAALALAGEALLAPDAVRAAPRTITMANGFSVEFADFPRPAPLNQMMTLRFRLLQDGKPAAATDISIDGLRMYSKNGLPTAPATLSDGKPGAWRIEGLRFHIAGPWRLVLRIQTNGGLREVVLPLEVK